MTLRALAGLFVLNGLYLAVGCAVLYAIRGGSVRALTRLSGLAYLLGVACMAITWTTLLVAGVRFGPATIAVTCGLLLAVVLVVARARERRVDAERSLPMRRSEGLLTAAGIALAGLYLGALFGVARLQGLSAFDAWAFWIPRAKAVYFFGGLDEQVFSSTPNPSYPPAVPILDAAAFHAMGSADTVTLHVQYWLFAVGFVAAIAGLLASRIEPWLLWPPLVLLLVLPRVGTNVLPAQADLLLDYLVVAAAVLIALWLDDRCLWRLEVAAVLLACGGIVKREGVVFAACILVAALAATMRDWRWFWPRLAALAVFVGVVAVPWRVLYRLREVGGEIPSTGRLEDIFTARALDSLDLAVGVLFDTGRWGVIPTLAVAALILALCWGSRRTAVFVGVAVLLITLSAASTSIAFPEIGITADEGVNPVVRVTLASVALCACLTPVLLSGVWRGRSAR